MYVITLTGESYYIIRQEEFIIILLLLATRACVYVFDNNINERKLLNYRVASLLHYRLILLH